MKVAIITGASSGMGYETALQLDRLLQKTDEIWLIARNKQKMEELSGRLRNRTRILPLDLTKEDSFSFLEMLLEEKKPQIRFLINCAGFGYVGLCERIPAKDQADMIECNCVGLTKMTTYCMPYFAKNARVIQFASSAAFLPQPGFAVYAATKSYVLSYSQALAEELRPKRVFVTAVCPGPVSTEFFDKAEVHGRSFAVKKYVMETPERVVERALRDSRRKRRVSVCGLPLKAFYLICKIVPHRLILMIMRILPYEREM